MSRFAILPAAAVLDNRLTLRELSVLAAIGTHTDRDGWCHPSSERLGEMLGVSGAMVRRSIQALKEAGYLQIIPRFNEDGGQTSSQIRVLFDTEHAAASLRIPEKRGPVTPGVTPPVTPGVTPPVTSEVTPPVTPEVAVMIPLNVPTERKELSCAAPPPATRSKFDAFWAAYPRKENKKKAEEVWKRKKLDSIADQIIADVQDRAARHKQWLEGFIPHPTTYLNGERWTDEIREEPLGGRGLSVSGVQQMPQSKTGQALLDIQRFRDELREEMGHET